MLWSKAAQEREKGLFQLAGHNPLLSVKSGQELKQELEAEATEDSVSPVHAQLASVYGPGPHTKKMVPPTVVWAILYQLKIKPFPQRPIWSGQLLN